MFEVISSSCVSWDSKYQIMCQFTVLIAARRLFALIAHTPLARPVTGISPGYHYCHYLHCSIFFWRRTPAPSVAQSPLRLNTTSVYLDVLFMRWSGLKLLLKPNYTHAIRRLTRRKYQNRSGLVDGKMYGQKMLISFT